MNQLYCYRKGHMKPILFYCIKQDCNLTQSCCSICLTEIHKNHKFFDFIQTHIQNIQDTIEYQKDDLENMNYKLKCKVKLKTIISSIATSSNGKLFSSGEDEGKIILWRIKGKNYIKSEYQGSHSIKCLVFSQNNKILIAATRKYNLLFNVNSNLRPFRFIKHSTHIANKILLTNDSHYLFQCSIKDRIISIWNIQHMKIISTTTTKSFNQVVISKNQKCLALCSWQNKIQLIDCQNLIRLLELGNWQSQQSIDCIEFTSDSKCLLITGNWEILKYSIDCLLTNSNEQPQQILKYSQYSLLSKNDSVLFSFFIEQLNIINYHTKEVIQSLEIENSICPIVQLYLKINLLSDLYCIIVNVNNHIYLYEKTN